MAQSHLKLILSIPKVVVKSRVTDAHHMIRAHLVLWLHLLAITSLTKEYICHASLWVMTLLHLPPQTPHRIQQC